MKKVLIPLCAVAAMVTLSGCLFPSGSPLAAPLQMNVSGPGLSFVDNAVRPLKSGRATASGIILFSEGDASIKAAMDNGGITKVHHVDVEIKSIFGIVASRTTIVWGE